MVRVRISCCICTSSRCPQDPPGVTQSEYAAVSGCGHVFHKACIEQWFNQQSKPICPICKTAYDVKCKTAGNRRIDKPLVRLWLDTGDGPSSDAFTQSTQVLAGQTYGRAKDKAKCVVPDDEEGDDIPGSDDDSNDVEQLRRQRNEALQRVRQQREELERLRQLQDQSEELEQLRAQNRQLEEDVETRDEQIVGLQADVDDMADQLSGLNADVLEEAAKDIDALEAENAELREREDDLSKETHDLKNTVRKLKEKLAVAGESGQEVIRQLGVDIAERDKEIMRLKARIDKFEDEMQAVKDEAKEKVEKARTAAEAARKKAQKFVEASDHSASVALADAAAQRQLVEQLRSAHKKYALLLRKAKDKYKRLQEQRGVIVPGSSEDDNDLYAPLPARASVSPSGSRQHSRASTRPPLGSTSTHNRRRSGSTSPAPQPFKIHNHSTLFSPTRKKPQRNLFEPALDDDDEDEEAAAGPSAPTSDDDDLIFVDPAPAPAPAASTSSAPTSRAPLRPTRSVLPGREKSPPRPSSPPLSLSPYFLSSTNRPVPIPMPTLVGPSLSQSGAGGGGGAAAPTPPKRPWASLASDRHLPDLGRGRVESGPKRKAKRK
ncbi:hypothetical protein JCM21900_003077 [Sporobolomyces salmonicolor]